LEGVKDKVSLAGKYLNVVRECGGVDVSKKVTDVPRTFDDVRFVSFRFVSFRFVSFLALVHIVVA
jgi:hypothetical protein